jgi:hypothetical protein
MANLPEVDQYDAGVYQLETTDPALGGANGIMNTPPKSLVNRTRYLLNRMLDSALSFVVDSGAVNAIVASFPQPIAALVDGMEVSFRVAVTNTTATTLKLTNTGGPTLTTLPIYGADYAALAGGELPAGATVRAKLNMSLNSSNGAWVVQSIAGGYAKIMTPAVGDASTKAANMAALFNAADGIVTVNVGVGADITLTAAQYGMAILKLSGTPTAPINLILPAQSGQWIIWNQQGGTNNITAKPSGGTGVVLPQGNAASIVCSDGAVASFASAQAGQVSFTPVTITGVTGTTLTVSGGYTPGALMIEKNGYLLEPGATPPDFTAATSPTITLKTAAVSTDVFTVYKFVTFNVANAVQKSGDVMAGALAHAGGDTIAVDPAASDNSTKIPSTKWIWNNIVALVSSVIGTVPGHGQCRLSVASTTQLKLSPYNGQNIIIGGTVQQVPSAGVTLSNAGLSASTLYYVYAYMSAGTMTLEAVTTAHVTQPSNGVEVKSTDSSRTLVGMIYTNASSQFVDSLTSRTCLNWFNRRLLVGNAQASNLTFTNTGLAEASTSARILFLAWADEAVYACVDGFLTASNAPYGVSAQSYVDSAAFGPIVTDSIPTTSYNYGYSSGNTNALSEGVHTAQVYAGLSGTGPTGTLVSCNNKLITRG